MNLRKFIDNLQAFAMDNPEALGFTVITASDDEGNSFEEVYHSPTLMGYNEEEREAYSDEASCDDMGIELNSVCVN